MTPALDKIRILDFSRVLAGPLATMVLADLGATVLKVERPRLGDDTRAWGPPHDDRGEATYFQSVNRNKTNVVLDLADPDDRAAAHALAAEADVIVENFRPGVMSRHGLGYGQLTQGGGRTDLVYCSITGFGRGPGADLPGYDLLVQALGGLMSITGPAAGEPQKVGVALVDVVTGLYATVGILAALRHRDATGEGQLVEVDLLSCLLAALVNQASAFTVAGVVPSRMGNAHPSIAPYELYDTREGDLVLAVGNDRQFAALCEVLAIPGHAEDPRFRTNDARVANRAELRHVLETQLAQAPAEDWAERLLARGVPAGQVNHIGGAFALAQRLGLQPIVEVPRDDGTAVRLPANPIRLSATPPAYRTAPLQLPAGGQPVGWPR